VGLRPKDMGRTGSAMKVRRNCSDVFTVGSVSTVLMHVGIAPDQQGGIATSSTTRRTGSRTRPRRNCPGEEVPGAYCRKYPPTQGPEGTQAASPVPRRSTNKTCPALISPVGLRQDCGVPLVHSRLGRRTCLDKYSGIATHWRGSGCRSRNRRSSELP
jgi:hypothetical protein